MIIIVEKKDYEKDTIFELCPEDGNWRVYATGGKVDFDIRSGSPEMPNSP